MKYVVSFSGGRTSAYLVHVIEQIKHENEWDVDYIFIDTGAEDPRTYDFVRMVELYYNIEITCIRAVFDTPLYKANNYKLLTTSDICDDLEPWRGMLAKYSTPYNPGGGFCTTMLKTRPYNQYCKDKYGTDNYQSLIGIRADEPRRLKPKDDVIYLAELSDFEKEDILDFWDDMPFNLDLDSDIEGNCLFCIKRGVNKIAVGVKRNPKQADRFINLLEESTVRQIDDRKASTLAMYRGEMSLTDIHKMYSHIEENEINEFIKRSGSVKSGSCSESCEALVCDTEYNDDGLVI